MAASVQFCWPSVFRNLAVCVQDLVAADIRLLPGTKIQRNGLLIASVARSPIISQFSGTMHHRCVIEAGQGAAPMR
jgi:hypothetical protein